MSDDLTITEPCVSTGVVAAFSDWLHALKSEGYQAIPRDGGDDE